MDDQASQLCERIVMVLHRIDATSFDPGEREASLRAIAPLREAVAAGSAELMNKLYYTLFYHNGSPYYESSDLRPELYPLRNELRDGIIALQKSFERPRG